MTRIGINYNLSLMNTNMMKARVNYSRTLEPLATGKKINHLGDSPTQLTEYLRLLSENARHEQYTLNVSTARTRVDITDGVLEELNNVSNQVYELAIQANDGSLSASDRNNIVSRLTDLRADMVDLANSKIGNNYMFAGFQSDTAPFTGVAGVFNGDTNTVSVKVTSSRTVDVSVNGDDLFTGGSGNVDIFQAMDDLITAVGAQDATAMGNAVTDMQDFMTQILTARSDMGNSMQQLDSAQAFLDNQETVNSQRVSVIGDTDMAKASAELSFTEYAMQAAFAVSQRIMQISLTSFLN